MSAFREIRGVAQRKGAEFRRWFQSEYFDLFLTEDRKGELQWFQLCYARDTWRERVLEWRRGRGFQHMKLKDHADPVRKGGGELVLDGVLPYSELMARFDEASASLPAATALLLAEKIREYARPSLKFRRPGAGTPRWLLRQRERERTAARLRFLDRAQAGG